jgi:hypothetical protein
MTTAEPFDPKQVWLECLFEHFGTEVPGELKLELMDPADTALTIEGLAGAMLRYFEKLGLGELNSIGKATVIRDEAGDLAEWLGDEG